MKKMNKTVPIKTREVTTEELNVSLFKELLAQNRKLTEIVHSINRDILTINTRLDALEDRMADR